MELGRRALGPATSPGPIRPVREPLRDMVIRTGTPKCPVPGRVGGHRGPTRTCTVGAQNYGGQQPRGRPVRLSGLGIAWLLGGVHLPYIACCRLVGHRRLEKEDAALSE